MGKRVVDPRNQYADLIIDRNERELDAEQFQEHRTMEAFRSGWVAGALTFDDDCRVLLVFDENEQQWFVPGGTLRPEETLNDGVIREIKEETGVLIKPVRPHAVIEQVVLHDNQSTSFTFVLYEAKAKTTTIRPDIGVQDEELTDAEWFESLPPNVYNRELTKTVLKRCSQDNE